MGSKTNIEEMLDDKTECWNCRENSCRSHTSRKELVDSIIMKSNPFFQAQPSNKKILVDLWHMLQETL